MFNSDQLGAYASWFGTSHEIGKLQTLSNLIKGLSMPESEDDALLQIINMLPAMEQSPNEFVQNLGKALSADPDGTLMKLAVGLHMKICNPLDFAVYLHSPKAVNDFCRIAPGLRPDPVPEESSIEDLVIV
jgi:hypothetical protein